MITVILCAAGSGIRANLPDNKIFFETGGLSVLSRSLSAFAPFAGEMLVAVREEDTARVRALLAPYPQARTVPGGKTRAESVFSALQEAKGDIVLVHDAARPFVSHALIVRCIAGVKSYGSAICALPVHDTVARVSEGVIADMPPRDALYSLQTPQGFFTADLLRAYRCAAEDGSLPSFTDDSGVYAKYVAPPHIFQGDRANEKLTSPEDFAPPARVGFGVDTHAFAHQDELDRGIARLNLSYIKLGGAVVPSDRELEAHSDGDVLCHALMDALLSAIGERDIGVQFPTDDPAYAGADSMKLLAAVMEKVRAAGFCVQNASLTVLAERPRLSPYIESIRQNLRAALGCDAVAVAAGTNEKLGYIGEGRGITCCALVLLREGA